MSTCSVCMQKLLVLFLTAMAMQSVATGAAEIVTIAGNGQPGFSASQINNPYGLTFGPDGGLYFCEIGNHVVRRLDLKTRALSVVAGTGEKGYSGDGGPATKAQLNEPYDVRFDSAGNMYFVEMKNNVVRRVDAQTHVISTLAKDLNQPHGLAIYADGDLLVADLGNKRVLRIDLASGSATSFIHPDLKTPRAIDVNPAGEVYLALRDSNEIGRLTTKFVPFANVKSPKGLSYAPDHSLYVADSENHRIMNINLVTNAVTAAIGTGERGDGPDGDPLQCKLARPHGILAAPDGKIYVADSENHRIRMLVYSIHGRTR
jgi:DNA-binding beta-propeller fold protein YncE